MKDFNTPSNANNIQIIALISGILAFLAFTVTSTQPLFDFDTKRIVEVISLSIILLCSTLKKTYNSRQSRKIRYALTTLLILGIGSCLLANSPKHAFIEAITFFCLIIAPYQIAPAWQYQKFNLYSALTLFAIILITETLFLSRYFAYVFSSANFCVHDFFPAFANVRFFNQFQIWTLPFVSLALLDNKLLPHQARYSHLTWTLATVWWCLFFTSDSRGAVIAAVSGFIFTIAVFKRQEKNLLLVTTKLALSGFILSKLLFSLLPALLNHNSGTLLKSLAIRSATHDRILLWQKAYQLIIENPFFGVGPMHYAWIGYSTLEDSIKNNHPHNSVLQWGAEWGIPSLLIVLWILLVALRTWLAKYNAKTLANSPEHQANVIIAVTISVVSAFIYSIVSGVIVMPTSQLTGVITISMMIYLYNSSPMKTDTNKHYIYLVVLIAPTYCYLLAPDIKAKLTEKKDTIEVRQEIPRFWSNGNIFHR